MRIRRENTLAVVIDMQERLVPHISKHTTIEDNIRKLIEGFKLLEIPVVVTLQYPQGLGYTTPALQESVKEFPVFNKRAFSCYDDPPFALHLEQSGKYNIILLGVESHICLLQTAIDLKEHGYLPVVVENCTGSRHEADREVALKRLQQEGVQLTTIESLLFELTRTSTNPVFKEISQLFK